MQPVTIVYVTDMDRSLAWYRAALPAATLVSTSPYWSEFRVAGSMLALHAADSVERGTQVGLALVADRALEEVSAGLAAAGIDVVRDIADEPFGRSMVIEDPDGLKIQINEHRAPE